MRIVQALSRSRTWKSLLLGAALVGLSLSGGCLAAAAGAGAGFVAGHEAGEREVGKD
jgi:hypothetical protein